MTHYTETTRDALIDAMLAEMERKGEALPESRKAAEVQPQG